MNTIKNVLVIGGSGFIGEAVCNQLAKAGLKITVPTRRYDSAKHLLTNPTCQIVQADIHDRAALNRLVDGQDAVVNLLGVLHSGGGKPYGKRFKLNHVEFPKALCAAMARQHVKRIVHISALGIGVENPAPSMYLRSKTDGEAAVKDSATHWTILRPSVVFGRNDSFLNMFAKLSKLAPVMPLAGANAKFQPVFVGDVARAVLACLTDKNRDTIHSTFDLVGPEVFTLAELVKLSGHAAGKNPLIIPVPNFVGKCQAFLMELAPGEPLMSRDNVDSMKIDNVRTAGKLFPLEHYEPLSVLAPEYIRARYNSSWLDEFRKSAHRRG
jgi:uncharacterized protein YbjT (DUF2867 family)